LMNHAGGEEDLVRITSFLHLFLAILGVMQCIGKLFITPFRAMF